MDSTAIIGQLIFIKGELTGKEDLTIDGNVEGKIELKENHLTIGPGGKIKADLTAKTVTIVGEVFGNVFAKEKVEIKETGKLLGNITAPRIAISEGALFSGTVDMQNDTRQNKDKTIRLHGKPLSQPSEQEPVKA